MITLGNRAAQGVTLGADLLLLVRGQCLAAPGGDPLQLVQPMHVAALVQQDGQTQIGGVLSGFSPVQVPTAWSVAGFTANAQFRPGRSKDLRLCIKAFAVVGDMAIRAHEVQVLRRTSPVQRIRVRHLLLGVQVKPALAAPLSRARVPGNG